LKERKNPNIHHSSDKDPAFHDRKRMGATIDVIISTCITLLALAATVQLKQRIKPNCSPGHECTMKLGKAGNVELPATIALQTLHKTYMSCQPPSGHQSFS
jgi:hypothetical protein